MTTKIEWTDETWNPVTGCTPISAGCKNCYAKRMATRLAGRYGYPEVPHHFDVTLHPNRLDEPLKWRKPRMVFVCSMGDLFHENVPKEWLVVVWSMMMKAEKHTFQVLTKRPNRMLDWVINDARITLPNVWLGVTVEHPDYLWRVTELLKIPAAVHFVSVEPMLGPLDFYYEDWDRSGQYMEPKTYLRSYTIDNGARRVNGLDWVICGAETGPGKRPMSNDWAVYLMEQCRATGTAFFFKKDSAGNHYLGGELYEEFPR